jgi:uncharacterized protein YjbI with pentapeptide repeats
MIKNLAGYGALCVPQGVGEDKMRDSPLNETASFGQQAASRSNANLAPLVLRNEKLPREDFSSRRDLVGAVFEGCDLPDANFRGVDLDRTAFSGCTLVGANFRRASLRGARISDCTGLTAKQFAGAQLDGAVLPDAIAMPPGLARISEISKRAYALLVLIVGACLTSVLVISHASDISLLANIGSLPLPGTEIKVPTQYFFVWMPPITALLWAFFQITLMHLWQEFADLPEVFPDGEARYRKADFWLFGGYVWVWNAADFPNAEWLRLLVFYILAWWLVPFTLLSFWVSYLRKHDMAGTGLQFAVIGFVLLLGAYFARKTKSIFQGGETVRPSKLHPITNGSVIVLMMTLYLLSNAATNGVADLTRPDSLADHDIWYRRIGQGILGHLHIQTKSRLQGVKLEDDQKDLNGSDLKYADAAGLIAPSANLRKATLTGANLSSAVLNDAHLDGANLEYSELDGAHLDKAYLTDVHLELSEAIGAHFNAAHLDPAYLEEAELEGADFSDADLSGSDFRGADLRKAKFDKANLAQVNFYMADLRDADFTRALNIGEIKCLALANVAGTVGLSASDVSGGSATINERDEDQYRRQLVRLPKTVNPPCTFNSSYVSEIEGPPKIHSDFSGEPRSLRILAIEWPEELPRHLKKEISTFLDAVQGIDAQDLEGGFKQTQTRLRFARSGLSLYARGASSSGAPSSYSTLRGEQVVCGETKRGFDLALSFEGVSPQLHQFDIDHYIEGKLGRGEEFGTERRWDLRAGAGGFVMEHHRGGMSETIKFATCLSWDELAP